MRSRPRRHRKARDETRASIDEALNMMLMQAKARFGEGVKSFWFYEGGLVPWVYGAPD